MYLKLCRARQIMFQDHRTSSPAPISRRLYTDTVFLSLAAVALGYSSACWFPRVRMCFRVTSPSVLKAFGLKVQSVETSVEWGALLMYTRVKDTVSRTTRTTGTGCPVIQDGTDKFVEDTKLQDHETWRRNCQHEFCSRGLGGREYALSFLAYQNYLQLHGTHPVTLLQFPGHSVVRLEYRAYDLSFFVNGDQFWDENRRDDAHLQMETYFPRLTPLEDAKTKKARTQIKVYALTDTEGYATWYNRTFFEFLFEGAKNSYKVYSASCAAKSTAERHLGEVRFFFYASYTGKQHFSKRSDHYTKLGGLLKQTGVFDANKDMVIDLWILPPTTKRLELHAAPKIQWDETYNNMLNRKRYKAYFMYSKTVKGEAHNKNVCISQRTLERLRMLMEPVERRETLEVNTEQDPAASPDTDDTRAHSVDEGTQPDIGPREVPIPDGDDDDL